MTFWKKVGRREPYTSAGIGRVPCVRCGSPAVHQWNVCADDNVYRALCLDCDIELNRLVLEWANCPDAAAKVARYEAKQRKSDERKPSEELDIGAEHAVPAPAQADD